MKIIIQLPVNIHLSLEISSCDTKKVLRVQNKTEVESVQLGNTYIADMENVPRTNEYECHDPGHQFFFGNFLIN